MNQTSPLMLKRLLIAGFCLLILSGCSGKSKVTFCHHPPGNPGNPHTLTIKINALRGVINEEYDYEGPCREETNPTATPAATSTPTAYECEGGMRCGEFNYTYGVADDTKNELEAQLYEVSTSFENSNNSERKADDAGNDPERFETGAEIDKVNTEFAEKDGLPTGKNTYLGTEVNAVILGE